MLEIYIEEGKIISRENISNDNAIIYEENLDEISGYTSEYMTLFIMMIYILYIKNKRTLFSN